MTENKMHPSMRQAGSKRANTDIAALSALTELRTEKGGDCEGERQEVKHGAVTTVRRDGPVRPPWWSIADEVRAFLPRIGVSCSGGVLWRSQ